LQLSSLQHSFFSSLVHEPSEHFLSLSQQGLAQFSFVQVALSAESLQQDFLNIEQLERESIAVKVTKESSFM
jgi:hypothetical protein